MGTTPETSSPSRYRCNYASVIGGVAGNWISFALVDVSLNACFVTGMVAGNTYNFRIRSIGRTVHIRPGWKRTAMWSVTTLSVVTQLALAPGSLTTFAYSDGNGGHYGLAVHSP